MSDGPDILIGTYLYPVTFLAPPDFDDKGSAADLIDTITTPNGDIHVTRIGGLFTIIPPGLLGKRTTREGHLIWDHLQAQLDFEQSTCQLFNLLICELCTWGRVAEPASPSFLGTCQLRAGRLSLERFPGAHVSYFDRMLYPAAATRDDDLFMMTAIQANTHVLSTARHLTTAQALSHVSPNLPTFVAAAYSLYSQHRLPEAIIDAWIACEQVVDKMWERHCAGTVPVSKHDRTLNVAARLRRLFDAGALPARQHDALQLARKHRNDLAHRMHVSQFAAMETVDCLRMLLNDLAGREVAQFPAPSGPMWDEPGPSVISS